MGCDLEFYNYFWAWEVSSGKRVKKVKVAENDIGIAQSSPEPPRLRSPAGTLSSSSSLCANIGGCFLWGYTCGLAPGLHCASLLMHTERLSPAPCPLLTGFDWHQQQEPVTPTSTSVSSTASRSGSGKYEGGVTNMGTLFTLMRGMQGKTCLAFRTTLINYQSLKIKKRNKVKCTVYML